MKLIYAPVLFFLFSCASTKENEWKELVAAVCENGKDGEAIQRIKDHLPARYPKKSYASPLLGRWQIYPDLTQHHQRKIWAIHAVDFVQVNSQGLRFREEGKILQQYFGFDAPVSAVADGTVYAVENNFPDNSPGEMGNSRESNYIDIQHDENEFSSYVHLKQGTVNLKCGDKVKKGQIIGRVGNSGASDYPHLHFAMLTILRDEEKSQWLSIPFCLEKFTLVEANGSACNVPVQQTQPQEGWVLDF